MSESSKKTFLKKSVVCFDCGSERTSCRKETDKFEYRDGKKLIKLEADVDVYRCDDCEFEFTDSDAEDARHQAICNYLGVFNPLEVKEVRTQYGLSRSQMADVSKIGDASLARWEAGSTIQNAAYDNYLFLLRYSENMKRVSRRRSLQAEKITIETQWTIKVSDRMRADQASFSLVGKAA